MIILKSKRIANAMTGSASEAFAPREPGPVETGGGTDRFHPTSGTRDLSNAGQALTVGPDIAHPRGQGAFFCPVSLDAVPSEASAFRCIVFGRSAF